MELMIVVGVLLLVWLALAVVCVRKRRVGWVVAAVLLPLPVTIVALLVAGIFVRPQRTGGLDDFSRAFAAIGAVGIGIVSSYIVLAVGATRPRADPVDSRAAPPGIARLIGGQRRGDQESDGVQGGALKPTNRVFVWVLLIAWLGAGYLLTTRVTGNDGLRFWLVASVWLALAAVCIQKRRGKWVLLAAVIPIMVVIVAYVLGFIVALSLAPEREPTDILFPSGMPEEPLMVAGALSLVAIVGSYLVLAIGAIRPTRATMPGKDATRVHYYTRWQGRAAGGDPADWKQGPDFHSLNKARSWAQATAQLQGVIGVEIYTDDSSGTTVVETLKNSPNVDP